MECRSKISTTETSLIYVKRVANFVAAGSTESIPIVFSCVDQFAVLIIENFNCAALNYFQVHHSVPHVKLNRTNLNYVNAFWICNSMEADFNVSLMKLLWQHFNKLACRYVCTKQIDLLMTNNFSNNMLNYSNLKSF